MSLTMNLEATAAPAIDLGITAEKRKTIADGLSNVLADTYTLYLKTHGYHWNVTGPMFPALHALFEQQYTELWRAGDDIAERIRALGHPAPASFQAFAQRTTISHDKRPDISDDRMVHNLVKGHEAAARTIRALLPVVNKAADDATADLLVGRLTAHEKTAWMLRSILG